MLPASQRAAWHHQTAKEVPTFGLGAGQRGVAVLRTTAKEAPLGTEKAAKSGAALDRIWGAFIGVQAFKYLKAQVDAVRTAFDTLSELLVDFFNMERPDVNLAMEMEAVRRGTERPRRPRRPRRPPHLMPE